MFAVAQLSQYLAALDVAILDASGTVVLEARTAGPWLMAELAPGRYRLVASYRGLVETRDCATTATRNMIVLRWSVVSPVAEVGATGQTFQ
jgi:hypothetical protein